MEIGPFIFRFSIFILSIFVGYYVVWSVTPSLHTPLMSVTNAISSVIIVGAIIAALASSSGNIFETSKAKGQGNSRTRRRLGEIREVEEVPSSPRLYAAHSS